MAIRIDGGVQRYSINMDPTHIVVISEEIIREQICNLGSIRNILSSGRVFSQLGKAS